MNLQPLHLNMHEVNNILPLFTTDSLFNLEIINCGAIHNYTREFKLNINYGFLLCQQSKSEQLGRNESK